MPGSGPLRLCFSTTAAQRHLAQPGDGARALGFPKPCRWLSGVEDNPARRMEPAPQCGADSPACPTLPDPARPAASGPAVPPLHRLLQSDICREGPPQWACPSTWGVKGTPGGRPMGPSGHCSLLSPNIPVPFQLQLVHHKLSFKLTETKM